jgi:hypothetical protein
MFRLMYPASGKVEKVAAAATERRWEGRKIDLFRPHIKWLVVVEEEEEEEEEEEKRWMC